MYFFQTTKIKLTLIFNFPHPLLQKSNVLSLWSLEPILRDSLMTILNSPCHATNFILSMKNTHSEVSSSLFPLKNNNKKGHMNLTLDEMSLITSRQPAN